MLDPKATAKIVEGYADYLRYNKDLLCIYEGQLLSYIEQDLRNQLNFQSYQQALHRIFPVNILTKVIDKLTNIYQTTVVREVVDGTPADEELLDWYEETMCVNEQMQCANEMYNLCKASLIHPMIYDGKPYLRVIQNDRFVVQGQDMAMPTKPTDVILLAGQKDGKPLYFVYDDYSFRIYVGEETDTAMMGQYGNELGVNPFGKLPFVYTPDSKYQLMPIQDSSMLKVVKTVPVILSDLNLAAMFQTFSILYGIDVDDENIKFAPNAFWKFKSDLTTDKKPEIGQIKPQVDIDQVIRLVEAELSMWLGTKGIRPGSVGQLTAENFSSGISKVIDEMDTYEARQKQVTVFQNTESRMWDLILNTMHPYWAQNKMIENTALFTPGAKIKTTFAVQLNMQSRGQLVKDLKEEIASGFTTKKLAISKLNPEMSEEDVLELMAEIDAERTINVITRSEGNPPEPVDTQGMDQKPEDGVS